MRARGAEEEQIERLAEDGNIYKKLSRSLAAEIFGHEDIKEALLLLVCAPHRKLKDSMMIKGDLYICLMGDLEAEHLLADTDICVIDEFDKMDDSNRIVIHEEKHDMRRTSAENINLPPALQLRFDLLCQILDRENIYSNLEMARHVVYVHQKKESPTLGFTPLEPYVLGAYILVARRLSPSIPKDLNKYIAGAYSSIRQEEAKSNTPHSYSTVRTLLSILRISAALSRLRFSEIVAQSDVDEALWLMQMSKFSLYSDDRQISSLDTIYDIYSILHDGDARMNSLALSYAQALNWICKKDAVKLNSRNIWKKMQT
ncbi:Mcm2-7 hexameric complex component [Datura stramonium]|uniref:DNA helicase n=1 Tax=Datura stramonium TaxID=4076 RepID=A0ABS8X075_DATST|nr:Mcm2-7 hexameric complex component [Datura stramonium]